MTTASLAAQAEVNFLVAMAKHDGDRVNYALVAVTAPQDRELVELYATSLSVAFPVGVIDPLAANATPFGDVSAVPVTVLLDREGHLVWRAQARVAKADEIRAAMRGL